MNRLVLKRRSLGADMQRPFSSGRGSLRPEIEGDNLTLRGVLIRTALHQASSYERQLFLPISLYIPA
ncbi:hypothetical protein MRX96_040371 [Rhipicephalus microplus]